MRGNALVWRALERARSINLADRGESPPEPSTNGAVSRRRLLQGIAASVVGLPSFDRAFAHGNSRIVIIGGGLAGLSALQQLKDNGVTAQLYEARGAAGGRTRSVRGVFSDSFAFDEGGQLVNSDHADMIAQIKRHGLTLVDRRSAGDEREVQIGRDGRVVDPELLAEALRPIAERITADADKVDRDPAYSRTIDALSVSGYLDRAGMPNGDGRDAIESGIRTEYGAEPKDASALELLFNLPTVDGTRLIRLSQSDERYLVDGGAGRVAEAMAATLEDQINLGKRLVSITERPSGLTLAFADGSTVTADQAILALPAPLYRGIALQCRLPDAWRALVASVDLGINEKLLTGFDSTPWRAVIGSGTLWSVQTFSEAWDANSAAAPSTAGAFCYFFGGDEAKAALAEDMRTLAERCTGIARPAITGLGQSNGRLRRTAWHTDPFARGAYVSFRPGQISRFGSLMTLETDGEVRASRAGRLIFAGEWLSDAWPGYMNGAIQTGRIAADAAIGIHSRTRRPESILR